MLRSPSLAAAALLFLVLGVLGGPVFSSPALVYVYDLRYTTDWSLPHGYEEQQFVAAIAGLWNRETPNLMFLLQDIDEQWLSLTSAPGEWLASTKLVNLTSLEALMSAFGPLGVVLYDPAVPATSLLASTIAGSDGLLPVPYLPDDPISLYSRVVAGMPRLHVGLSLVGLFNDSGPLKSAKAEAYAWAIKRQLLPDTPPSDGRFLAYYADYFCASNQPYMSDPIRFDKITVGNHDWTIAHSGFFFDLAPWGDEAPIDDKGQPLGTDLAWLHTLLDAAYNASAGTMVHISGFTPWWCKYAAPFSPNGHSPVAAEWATSQISSSFNAFVDADACCIGNMASASFWQHYPLQERYVQRPPPSRRSLIDAGLLTPASTVPVKLYYMFYAGDFDSSAWLYSQLLPRWDDPARGSVPIGWAVDPELALRFPPIFPLIYSTATPADVIVTGDSGAGYVNPTQLYGPARRAVSGLPDGRTAWADWCTAWYRQFGMSFTGFIITGAAPQMGPADELAYYNYSGNGIVVESFPGNAEHMSGNLPVTYQTDIPPNVTDAAATIEAFLPASVPRFWMFRSILTSPSFLASVQEAAALSSGGQAVAVDPLTLGFLMRAALDGSNDNRVSYVADTVPTCAPAGSLLSFNVTLRNDGWNVLAARNHSLVAFISSVQLYRAAPRRPVRKMVTSSSARERFTEGLGGGRFPAHPRRAALYLKRLGFVSACDGARSSGGRNSSVTFPADLGLGAELSVPLSIPLPQLSAVREACPSASAWSETVASVTLTYQVWQTVAGKSSSAFSSYGNIPWETVILLE